MNQAVPKTRKKIFFLVFVFVFKMVKFSFIFVYMSSWARSLCLKGCSVLHRRLLTKTLAADCWLVFVNTSSYGEPTTSEGSLLRASFSLTSTCFRDIFPECSLLMCHYYVMYVIVVIQGWNSRGFIVLNLVQLGITAMPVFIIPSALGH